MRFLNHKVTRLVLLGIVLGVVLSFILLLVPWLPAQDSAQANRTDRLITAITFVSCGIFGLVMTVMLYSVVKFRRRGPDDMRDGAPVHGHTGLEIFWTGIPVIIVTIFGFWAGLVLRDNERVGQVGSPLRTVLATGSQFQWTFKYVTDGGFESNTLYLPLDRGVKIETTATDVIHGFYVKEWRVKKDAVPGQINYTFATPDRVGTFRVLCSQLCGGGHAAMQSANNTEVVSAADFKTWVAKQKQSAATTPPAQKIFLGSAGCGGCHTLSKAGSKGTIGPDLDNVATDAKAAGQSVTDYVRESIVAPNKYIAKGFPANVMPKIYGSTLSKKDLAALVAYVSGDSK